MQKGDRGFAVAKCCCLVLALSEGLLLLLGLRREEKTLSKQSCEMKF